MLKKLAMAFIATLIFATAAFADQTVALKAGFNFVSLTVTPSVTPAALKQSANLEDIYYFNAAAGSFVSVSEGSLTSFAAGKGYIFKSFVQTTITVAGAMLSTVGNINIKSGFNLVGFSKMPETITGTALMSNYEAVRGIYKWIPASGSFIQVVRDASNAVTMLDGVDPQIKAGESYFMYFTSEIQLNYDSDKVIFGTNIVQKVSKPVMSPPEGLYTSAQSVQITCETPNAQIYYTLDGTTPSAASGTLYGAPITVSSGKTIKAIAVAGGAPDSDAASASYMFSIAVGQVLSAADMTAAQTAAKRFLELWAKGSMGGTFTAAEVAELNTLAASDFMLDGVDKNKLIQYASGGGEPSSESREFVSISTVSQPMFQLSSTAYLVGYVGSVTFRDKATGQTSVESFDTVREGLMVSSDYKYYSCNYLEADGPENLITRKESDGKWRVAGNGVRSEKPYVNAQYTKDISPSAGGKSYAMYWISVNESSLYPIQSVSVSGGYISGAVQLQKSQSGSEWIYSQGNALTVATNPDWSLYPVRAGQEFKFVINYADGFQQTFVHRVSTLQSGLRPLDGTASVSGNTVTLTWEKCPFSYFKNYSVWNSVTGDSQEFSDINKTSTTLDISGVSSGGQVSVNFHASLKGGIQTGYQLNITKQ